MDEYLVSIASSESESRDCRTPVTQSSSRGEKLIQASASHLTAIDWYAIQQYWVGSQHVQVLATSRV